GRRNGGRGRGGGGRGRIGGVGGGNGVRAPCSPVTGDLDQFVEQLAVVEHGVAQVVGGGPAIAGPAADGPGLAVAGQGRRVVDGQRVFGLGGIGGRVTAGPHDRADQRAGLGHGLSRGVDEPFLDGVPLALVAGVFFLAEGP